MKYGERVQFDIEYLDEKGRGCGTLNDPERFGSEGRKACAHGTIPGESIEASFVGKKRGVFRFGEIDVLKASPDRTKTSCPHADDCGGCSLQHISYERQLTLKSRSVDRTLTAVELNLKIDKVVAAKELFGYRNRMDYVFGPNGELGLKMPGRWNRFVDLETCLMLSKEAVEILHQVKQWAAASGHHPWDNRKHEGYLRYLVIREGKFTRERLVTLVTHSGELSRRKNLVARLSPLCTTLYHGINPTITDISTASEFDLLHGKPELSEKISGITYAIRPNSFFQTNSGMAEVLLERVRKYVLAGPRSRLLDLYCGVGFFSLAMSKETDDVLGIELDPEAIKLARQNAKENGVSNTRFRSEQAETLSWIAESPDVVIIDPPRSGLHPKVRDVLLKRLPPRIIYISCNYRALANDLKHLLTCYDAADSACLDLFPQTPHIETVVHLIKKK